MKQVINPRSNDDVVAVTQVSERSFYGFTYDDNKKKGFITRAYFDSGKFRAVVKASITIGNGLSDTNNQTLKGLISELVARKDRSVFQFESSDELFAWLAE